MPLVDFAEGGLDVAQASIHAADGVGQHGAVRESSMRVFTPEICADTRPAATKPVPTMVPMIGFVSVLTELQRTTVRATSR